MPIHDWTRVEAGIFHDFHHAWIEEIKRALNGGILPEDYYALAEQQAIGFGPDVLTLQAKDSSAGQHASPDPKNGGTALLVAPPRVQLTLESDMEFFRRKKSRVVVRHVSGDRVVAMVEIVSPGNKAGRSALRSFVEKATEVLDKRVHLLVLDVLPPGKRDPNGMHAAIWEEITGQDWTLPLEKPLTLASYESAETVRAYVETVAVGDVLPDMPLFLEPGAYLLLPLETIYQTAWKAIPRRWQRVLEEPAQGPNSL